MKTFSIFVSILSILCLWIPTDSIAAEIYAGVAKTDITPPTGGGTTGYSSAKPTDGIHDPLSARVLLLKASETTVAIVSWDLCIHTSPELFEQVSSLDIDYLLLLNTHTHAGPKMDENEFPSVERPWKVIVDERVLDAIKEAKENMFPAYIAASQGEIQLGYNRLVRQPGGYAITHFENPERIPFGPVDPTAGVIRITDEYGTIRAVLVCYALHPVVLGPRNRKISADFPGVMRDLIEKELGDETMCMFIQGGAGDINPLILARTGDPEMDFPLVETVGTLLAENVLSTIKYMKDVDGRSEELLAASEVFEVKSRWEPDETIQVGVTSLLINQEIGIVSMPGEPFHKFQNDLRNQSALPFTFLFGYGMNAPYDWPRYLPDLESAARGGYGASDATVAAVGTGERIINEGLKQLYELRGMLKDKPQRHIFD